MNDKQNTAVDFVKSGDWVSYRRYISELNKSLYSELKEKVSFFRVVDNYLLSRFRIDRIFGNVILFATFAFLIYCLSIVFSFDNLQFALLGILPTILMYISLVYIFLRRKYKLYWRFILLMSPLYLLLIVLIHFVFCFILSCKNYASIIGFMREINIEIFAVFSANNFFIYGFHYYFREKTFDDLSTIFCLVIAASTLNALICAIGLSYSKSEEIKCIYKSKTSQFLVFLIFFIASLGAINAEDKGEVFMVELITFCYMLLLISFNVLFPSENKEADVDCS